MAKILICDDAVFMRLTIKDTLEGAGHEVVAEAPDVDEAVALYRRLKPDIVTMDLLMKKSGVDAVKEIIKIDPAAKIIIVSVLDKQEEDVVAAVRAGALGLVTKPIKREVLVDEVKRVINLKKKS